MTERRWIPAVVLVGVAALVALVFLALGGERRGRSGTKASAPAAERPATEPGPVPRLVESVAELERVPLAPTAPGTTASVALLGTRRVRVVEALNQRPVSGAEVWALDRKEAWNPLGFDELTKAATALRADEQGWVEIPFDGESSRLVLARAPGLLGGERVEAPGAAVAPAHLELHPDWDLEVEVQQSDGRPAPDVLLSLALPRGTVSAETDAEGRERYEHVGYACSSAGVTRLELRVELPLATPLHAVLEAAPVEPVRFRLPPLASLELTVLDAERQPVPDGTELELGLVRPGEARDVSPFSSQTRAQLYAEALGGSALFEHVEPGHELELVVRLASAVAERKVYFPGPARAGERVRHTVVLAPDHPVLEFRALESAGPLADASLELRLVTNSSGMSSADELEARTDAAGRFRFELPATFQEGEQRTLWVGARAGSLGARVDLSRAFEPGSVALGDVLLAAAPLVVAGRVLDGAGNGVEGAELELASSSGESPGNWQSVERELASSADGTFALHALLDAQDVRLRARSRAQRSRYVSVPLGTRSVELVLLETGSLAGSLRLDPAVPVAELQLGCTPEDGAAREEARASDWIHHGRVQDDGAFLLEPLLPGRYRFRVSAKASRPLAEVDGIEIVAGETCRDPRLQGFDLRTAIRARRFTLVFPEPTPDVQGGLQYFAPGRESERRYDWFHESPFVVLTELPSFDGWLSVSGFRPVQLEGVSGDREIRLQPALRVRLVLPTEVALPAPPAYLKAALAPAGDEDEVDGELDSELGWELDWGAEVFDERREIRCLASEPGPMRVVWISEQRSGSSASASTFEVLPVQLVEVLDVGYEQRFELEVDPQALARALAQVR